MKRTSVKFCGFRTLSDVKKAIDFDIDFLGFICVPNRKRTVEAEELRKIIPSIPSRMQTVGVFINPTLEAISHWHFIASFSAIQLHGDESPSFCRECKERFSPIKLIKVFHLEPTMEEWNIEPYLDTIDVALFDASVQGQRGGTGQSFDWTIIPTLAQECREAKVPFWVAGGVTPSNVSHLLKQYHPDGIDVSSGIEKAGVKDRERMKALVEKVRQIDHDVD